MKSKEPLKELEAFSSELLKSEMHKYESLADTYMYACKITHTKPNYKKLREWQTLHDIALEELIKREEI